MALLDIITKGSVDRSVPLRLLNSTTGAPKTDSVYSTVDLWYRREGAAKVSITEVTLASLATAHTDGGFLHVSDGEYRLDSPDAAFATGANYVDFGGTGTGAVVLGGRVKLVNYNMESAAVTLPTPMPTGWITADGIAADALGSSELATTAVDKIVTAIFARAFSSSYNNLTFDQVNKIFLSVIAGKVSGAGTALITFRNPADTGDVVVAITTVEGNRTAVTLTP